jgi:hypothetical protein
MKHSYEITPRSIEVGGGWRLRLLEDGEEVGGGVFPIDQDDPQAGMTWWNARTEQERAHWLSLAGTAVAADAWTVYMLAEAHADAEATAYEWLDSRVIA